ncbi:MAG: heat-inducible transcriptional repressor HrcA [Syntrophomonadaceae bacterium]|jgi:heat-inducible transcriptional repressor|nr:heat-inducible transcriptional repressor HrcA [Syntrophomonadaceae bacterium]MDH7497675.1 heat-inducible transcriptional repressor HrcA [Syntrophomonadaceae bacterium]
MDLDERKRIILEAVIRDYVETAEPVGSRAIVRKHGLGVSAATVRNEMADLEAMGFLEQPHTSAGRIPSEQGFRYYVDCMMAKEEPGPEDLRFLRREITERISDISEVIQKTSASLSQLTGYACFAVSAVLSADEIKSVQLIPVQAGKAVVVVVTSAGEVLHTRIDIPDSIGAGDLQELSQLFTRALKGTRVQTITRTMLETLRDELLGRREVIERALQSLGDLLDSSGEERVTLTGTLNMFNEPEFKNLSKLRSLLALLQENDILKRVVGDAAVREVRIKIGRENQVEEIKELSVVFTDYEVEGEKGGKLGLIGPVRMEYWKAAGSLDSVREIVEETIRRLIK